MNNYPIHTLVHKDAKYVKVNTLSKGNLVENLNQYSGDLKDSLNVFVIDLNQQAEGVNTAIQLKYADDICISNYNLSALCIASRLCFVFEEHW